MNKVHIMTLYHDDVNDKALNLPPWQVEDASVVLLPVRDKKTKINIPEEAEHTEDGHREAVIVSERKTKVRQCVQTVHGVQLCKNTFTFQTQSIWRQL